MLRFLSSCAFVSASLFAAGAAFAEEPRWPNWYVGLHAGMNAYDEDNTLTTAGSAFGVEADEGYILGVSVGYKPDTDVLLLDAMRIEAEYSFRGNGLGNVGAAPQSGDLLSHTLMANVLMDFENPTIFTPYIGAGLGISEFDFNGDDETADAWQMLAGVDYTPADDLPMTWGVRYRYLDGGDGGIQYNKIPSTLTYENHSFEMTSQLRF